MKKYALVLSTAFILALGAGTAIAAAPDTPPNPTDGYNKDLWSQDADNGALNANDTGKNVNGTGQTRNDNANFSDVIKSDNMYDNNFAGPKTQRTHGEYQNNTNSCASCHQTHTAAAKSLLFKQGVYNTCTACHDGTLGFYNVFANDTYDDKGIASTAGTFGGTKAEGASMHLADASVQIKAAPGGNKTGSGSWVSDFTCASCHSPHGSYSDRLLHYNPNTMGNTAPAGGGIKAAKSVVYDIATGLPTSLPVFKAAVDDDPSTPANEAVVGDGLANAPTVAEKTAGWKPANKYIAVRGTKVALGLAQAADADAATKAVVVYKWQEGSPNKFVKAVDTPWLYGYDYGSPYKSYWTRLFTSTTGLDGAYVKEAPKDASGNYKLFNDTNNNGTWDSGEAAYFGDTNKNKVMDAGEIWLHDKNNNGIVDEQEVVDLYDQEADAAALTINFGKGYAQGTLIDSIKAVDIAQAYVVKLDLVELASQPVGYDGVPILTVNEKALFGGNIADNGSLKAAGKVDGKGTGILMSAFCAACHTDYMAKSGTATGVFDTTSYRHTTNSDTYTCLRCHFAHGNSIETVKDAEGKQLADFKAAGVAEVDAKAYLQDKNPSSALKRYTNMAVCWACHTDSKAEQLKNNNFYQVDNKANVPHGLTDTN